MIEPALFFALGLLSAGFLFLLAAPAFARRARRLERRHLEATLPLSANELQAEKDRVRADAAVQIRKAEVELKAVRDKNAEQAIAIGRGREDARLLKEESSRRQAAITALEGERDELRQALAAAQEQVRGLEARITGLEETGTRLQNELDELGKLYEEASFSASSRQIEMVGRESDIDRLGEDLQGRERELAKLRDELQSETSKREALAADLAEAKTQQAALEAELADASNRATGLFPSLRSGENSQALAKLTAERDRLETRLAALMRENRKLREAAENRDKELEAAKAAAAAPPPEPGSLREQMASLAAEVVALAAKVEGPDGPIDRILAATPDAGGGEAPSLAARIQALRDAAQNSAS